MRWMKSWRSRSPTLTTCALVCGLASLGACVQVHAARPPPCPVASLEAIDQTTEFDSTPLATYLGQIERYCWGIEALRGN